MNIQLVITGTLGSNGWYTSNVTATWIVTGQTDSTGCDTKTLTADTKGTTLTCSASNLNTGSSTTFSKTFKIDKTAPTVTAAPSRPSDANGWYNHALSVGFSGTDATSGIAGCSSSDYSGPDSAAASVGGSCTDVAGNVGRATFTFKIDTTPPSVAATPNRAADANGWYNHPLSIAFSGTDATSSIAGCSSADFAGPDNPKAAVPGSCTDVAGNVGAAVFSFAYDATPPSVAKLAAKAGNRQVGLTWTASPDTQTVQVTRAPGSAGAGSKTVYQGSKATCQDTGLTIGEAYRYTVTGFDEAGNTAAATISITATGLLLSPVPRARVSAPPMLVWTAVRRARYYNVQLVRGRKVLSVWPSHPYFQLPRSWVFKGKRYRLKPGVYHWYVWPGYGSLSASRYGRSLGGSSFVVTGRAGSKKHT